jgi:uncharacterized RDD family membrane protein YckC
MDMTDLEYVGFWPRVLATIVDTLVLSLVLAPFADHLVNINIEAIDAANPPDISQLLGQLFDPWSVGITALGVLLFWLARQATPGKMVISARIVDAKTGGKPASGQLLLRYLGYYVSMLGLGLGFVWVAFDSRKQGWHDKMADTVVVRSTRKGSDQVVSKRMK